MRIFLLNFILLAAISQSGAAENQPPVETIENAPEVTFEVIPETQSEKISVGSRRKPIVIELPLGPYTQPQAEHFAELSDEQQKTFLSRRKWLLKAAARIFYRPTWLVAKTVLLKDKILQRTHDPDGHLPEEVQQEFSESGQLWIRNLLFFFNNRFWESSKIIAGFNKVSAGFALGVQYESAAANAAKFGGAKYMAFALGINFKTGSFVIDIVPQNEVIDTGVAMNFGLASKGFLKFETDLATKVINVDTASNDGVIYYPPALPAMGYFYHHSADNLAFGYAFGLGTGELPVFSFLAFSNKLHEKNRVSIYIPILPAIVRNWIANHRELATVLTAIPMLAYSPNCDVLLSSLSAIF